MKKFLCAVTFLTRIPVPNKNDFEMKDFSGSIYFFPIVGLIIGGLLALCWSYARLIFPPLVTGALVVLLHLLLTGGLHLDGMMDTLDGMGGGRTPEQRLAIMKDSHSGAFGVQGAVMILLLKFALYAQLNKALIPFLVVTPVIAREVMVWVQVGYPYARKKGLGSFFSLYGDYSKFMITTAITLAIMVAVLQLNGLVLFLLAGVFTLVVASFLNHQLGGLTGDTYGALCELTEVFILIVSYLMVTRHMILQ